jgi:molybdate transport system ATP-binding protein
MASSTDSASSGDLIRLEHITLRVGGRWILPDTSWTIAQGQNWVILGPNGSGKTSLTAALTGEVPVVAGRRWRNPDAIRPQDIVRLSFETHQRLIARDEALDEARGFAGIDEQGLSIRFLLDATEAKPETVAAFIDRWDLFPLLDQPIRSLSTGEMRRFLIARTLLFNPRLLILDEPFDGLDASMRRYLADRITALVREGLQVILVTHRDDVAHTDRSFKQDDQPADEVGYNFLQAETDTDTQRRHQPLQLRPVKTQPGQCNQDAGAKNDIV